MTLWAALKAQKLGYSDDLFAQLAAEKLNGGRMPRNTIAIPHGKGTFKATAEGKNVVWQYGSQEIHGNTCEFTVTEDNAQILVSFDGLLTKFENKSDAQTLLDLSDLGGLATNYLNLYNCSNVTGDLSALGGRITHYLGLYNCSKITGSLSDLGGKITHWINLGGCRNVTGVYSGDSYPTSVNLSNTGLTAADMDQTLINFNAGATSAGTFTAKSMTRTAASDDAVAGLISRGWTVTGLTKLEEAGT